LSYFFSSRRRHTRSKRDWSSDVCSYDLPMTSKESVHHLELSAIQQAQIELVKANNQQFTNYHCVGYSVLHYYIDDERIGSLIDQSGKEAGVEIITTFLPKVVIESL